MKKTTFNRLIIFGSASIIIIVFFIVTLISYSFQTQKLKKEQYSIENKIKDLIEEGTYFQDEIVKLSDMDYLARYARENYMYSKNGEYIIKINKSVVEEESEASNNSTIYIIVIAGGSLLILLIVLKKIFTK